MSSTSFWTFPVRSKISLDLIWILGFFILLTSALPGRNNQKFNPHVTLISAQSQQQPKVGYLYPVPAQSVVSSTRSQLKFPQLALPRQSSPHVERLPSASAQEPSIQQVGLNAAGTKNVDTEVELPKEDEIPTTTELELPSTTIATGRAETLSAHQHHPEIDAIDVACGKDKMTVRVTFDSVFDGIIYAKGHYADPKCRFVVSKSEQRMYQFELTTGECGVSFIDDGLTEGGQAYVEALLVIIFEPGVQEAWDASRKIRCLWEGNLEQTVTFPLSVNMLEQKLLTFSGDTASVALEIQAGDGPRATPVQGLVRIGDMLTAVVTVQGDTAFDILVRNCVATDGTITNRILLSDARGCALKPKLMGGWTKEKGTGGVMSFARLSAFKFPDVMDLFLECTVSLCKGTCDECPAAEFLELHVPAHDDEDDLESSTIPPPEVKDTKIKEITSTSPKPNVTQKAPEVVPIPAASMRIDVKTSSKPIHRKRPRRSPVAYDIQATSAPVRGGASSGPVTPSSLPEESLQLRRVVHVVGPDDFPEFSFGSFAAASSAPAPTIYGSPNGLPTRCPSSSDCFSLLGLISAISLTALTILISVAIFGTLRRHGMSHKF